MRRSRARVRNERQARDVAHLAAGVVNRSRFAAESLSRALPEVPERKSVKEGRRGGFATRADTTPPRHVGAASENSENPAGIPSRLAGRWIGSPSRSESSPSSGRRPSPLRGRIRRGFPVLRVEWPGPWKIVAERKPTSKWWWGKDSNLRRRKAVRFTV